MECTEVIKTENHNPLPLPLRKSVYETKMLINARYYELSGHIFNIRFF